ncbi:MAG TPA: tetratricopeptide repeat protein [Verrucomicrobiae bacterium]
MSAKINPVWSAVLFLALILAISGCTPAGPRALLKGKKYLDRGDYTDAVAQLKTATDLISTNAAAWNYYGVALQRVGQPDDAVNAYNRALELDRDLLEARLNLGTLFLEQNKPDAAKTEFTACTLRRPNDAITWLRLGSAQLKLGETVPAERSFSAVLALKTNEAEAYNGLGLARIQRSKPIEASKFFTAAVKMKPDFAAAILNLATVNQQFLHDNKTALENYRAYLALTPKPAHWDEVTALADALEQASAPVTKPNPPPVVATISEPKPQPKNSGLSVTHPVQSPRAQTTSKPVMANPAPSHLILTAPVQVVQVAPEPKIVTTPNSATAGVEQPVLEMPVPEQSPKPSLWHKLFGSENPENSSAPKFVPNGVTPLPGETIAPTTPAAPEKKVIAPVVIVPPAPDFPRYDYLSPRRPQAGDRRAAAGAFTQARMAEQNENWTAALADYRQAATFDPAWFEAQYNAGVVAHRLRNFSSALTSYEMALTLQPDSVDARYNFALALKAAGFVPDAAEQLKKILAANPGEVRAHLALANLCAQSLRDPAQARQHYLKVLELDPRNPQTTDIRFWLAANPD